jgi:hypothetical protein
MKYVGLFSLTAARVLSAGIQPVNAEMPLSAGATAPASTLPPKDNIPVSSSDYKAKWVVLHFYPMDNKTPGCTFEAHDFQRDLKNKRPPMQS